MAGTSSCSRARDELREVNFWRPGGGNFGALTPGEPFFFKLKAPYNAIGVFGLFARFARLPIWRAWDVFGQANGTSDEYDLAETGGDMTKFPTPGHLDAGAEAVRERDSRAAGPPPPKPVRDLRDCREVFDYVEIFYNATRRHSTLGMLSPSQYEEVMITANDSTNDQDN